MPSQNAPANPSWQPSHDVKVHVLAAPLQRDVVAHAPLVQNKLAQLLSPATGRGRWSKLSLLASISARTAAPPAAWSCAHVMGLVGCSSLLSRSASSLLLSGPAHRQGSVRFG